MQFLAKYVLFLTSAIEKYVLKPQSDDALGARHVLLEHL